MTNYKTVSIDNATIDTQKFREYYSEALRVQGEIEALDEEFKQLVESAQKDFKLPKPALSSFFKARFKAKTKQVVKRGELFDTLNDVLDN